MNQEILIGQPFARVAVVLGMTVQAVLPEDQGFLSAVTDRPAPRARMRARVNGGPDGYDPLPPLAGEAVIEVWHTNFRNEFFRCLQARLAAEQNGPMHSDGMPATGTSRLSWAPEDIRVDVRLAWQVVLDLIPNFCAAEPTHVEVPGEWPYLPPLKMVEQRVFVNLPMLDEAFRKVFEKGFAPGHVRYERLADPHGGGDLVRYRIKGDLETAGDYGEVWLRAGGPEWTLMTVSALAMRQEAMPVELVAVLALPLEQQAAGFAELIRRYELEGRERLRHKAAYLQQVVRHCYESLPAEWLSPFRRDAADELTRAAKGLTSRDMRVVQLWDEGLTDTQIARQVGLSAGAVRNEISRLRKLLGPEKVRFKRGRGAIHE